jgi:hypothetical protein
MPKECFSEAQESLGEPTDDQVTEQILRALQAHAPNPTDRVQRSQLSDKGRPNPIPSWTFGWLGKKELVEPVGDSDKHRRQLTAKGKECLARPELIEEMLSGKGNFVARVNRSLAEFARRERLQTEGERPWILAAEADWQKNLWQPLRGLRLLPSLVDKHRWAHHLRSSQAFALNLFGPLQASVDNPTFAWATEVWGKFFDGITAVQFEHPAAGDPLEEATTNEPHRTRVDVRVEFGGNRVALIEVKYTEPSFGGCSAHYSEANETKDMCSAPGWNLGRMRSCYLERVKNRTYFEDAAGSCFDFAAMDGYASDHRGCPFLGGLYQIMRNARMIDKNPPDKNAEFVVLAPKANKSLHSTGSLYGWASMEEFLAWAIPGNHTRYISFEDVMAGAQSVVKATEWKEYMGKKYLDALAGTEE